MSEPRCNTDLGISNDVTCLRSLRHPAYRQRELNTGVYMERENLSLRCEEKTSSQRHDKRESIDARHRGGNFRSSDETSVMEVERREVVIQFLVIDENYS